MSDQIGLAVLEARWWPDGNHSVRPLFDTLASMHHNNPFGYRYDMFSDKNSFQSLVESLGKTKGIHYLHVASHGVESGNALSGALLYNSKVERFECELISRKVIKNAIQRATSGRGASLTGIYFGSCYFGNPSVSEFILSSDDKPTQKSQDDESTKKLIWVAGYDKQVSWVDAAIVEMFFWDQFRYFAKESPQERVIKVTERIKKFMPGAIEELGFDVFVRKRGRPQGGITSLVHERLSSEEIET